MMAKSYHLPYVRYYNSLGTEAYLDPTMISSWCRKNFGPPGRILPKLWCAETRDLWVEGGAWINGSNRVLFASDFDADVFELRWRSPPKTVARREAVLARLGKTYRDLLHGRYHLVRPRKGASLNEATEWCDAQFGPMSHQPKIVRTGRWIDMGDAFFIRDAADAVAFKLRWG